MLTVLLLPLVFAISHSAEKSNAFASLLRDLSRDFPDDTTSLSTQILAMKEPAPPLVEAISELERDRQTYTVPEEFSKKDINPHPQQQQQQQQKLPQQQLDEQQMNLKDEPEENMPDGSEPLAGGVIGFRSEKGRRKDEAEDRKMEWMEARNAKLARQDDPNNRFDAELEDIDPKDEITARWFLGRSANDAFTNFKIRTSLEEMYGAVNNPDERTAIERIGRPELVTSMANTGRVFMWLLMKGKIKITDLPLNQHRLLDETNVPDDTTKDIIKFVVTEYANQELEKRYDDSTRALEICKQVVFVDKFDQEKWQKTMLNKNFGRQIRILFTGLGDYLRNEVPWDVESTFAKYAFPGVNVDQYVDMRKIKSDNAEEIKAKRKQTRADYQKLLNTLRQNQEFTGREQNYLRKNGYIYEEGANKMRHDLKTNTQDLWKQGQKAKGFLDDSKIDAGGVEDDSCAGLPSMHDQTVRAGGLYLEERCRAKFRTYVDRSFGHPKQWIMDGAIRPEMFLSRAPKKVPSDEESPDDPKLSEYFKGYAPFMPYTVDPAVEGFVPNPTISKPNFYPRDYYRPYYRVGDRPVILLEFPSAP